MHGIDFFYSSVLNTATPMATCDCAGAIAAGTGTAGVLASLVTAAVTVVVMLRYRKSKEDFCVRVLKR